MTDKETGGIQAIFAGFKSLFQTRQPVTAADTPGQKRKLTRMRCEYRVDCYVEGKSFPGMVVDMSLTGMRLQVTKPVKAGSLLSIKYDTATAYMTNKKFDIDTVHTRVIWCRKRREGNTLECGVSYTDTDDIMSRSWVKFILKQLGFEMHGIMDRRKHVRVKAMLAGELGPASSTIDFDDGVIVNLGAGGCLFEGPVNMRPGTRVSVRIGPLPGQDVLTVEGKIAQANKLPDENRWRLGIQFEQMTDGEVDLLGKYIAGLVHEMMKD